MPPAPSPPPHDGASSLLSTAASVATAVAAGASSLFQRPAHTDTALEHTVTADANSVDAEDEETNAEDEDEDVVYVGLVSLQLATNDRDRVKNDVILTMAIREVTETLYVFVNSKDTHASLVYTSELHTVTWDLAASLHKLQLKIEITSAAMAPHAWSDVFSLPDLGAVYGDGDVGRHGAKQLSRSGLLPVVYRSPEHELRKYARPGMTYFDDLVDGGLHHRLVLVQGTFDHLHNGHRRLLTLAASVCSERLVVGITAAPSLLAAQPFAEFMEPLALRKEKVSAFVASIQPSIAIEFIDVHDRWGPAAKTDDTRTLYVMSSTDIDHWDATRTWRFSHGLADVFVRMARRGHHATLRASRIREAMAKAKQ